MSSPGGSDAVEGATGDQGTDALGDALQMMVQALSQMHEAIQKIEVKIERTDESVRCMTDRMAKVELKMNVIEMALSSEVDAGDDEENERQRGGGEKPSEAIKEDSLRNDSPEKTLAERLKKSDSQTYKSGNQFSHPPSPKKEGKEPEAAAKPTPTPAVPVSTSSPEVPPLRKSASDMSTSSSASTGGLSWSPTLSPPLVRAASRPCISRAPSVSPGRTCPLNRSRQPAKRRSSTRPSPPALTDPARREVLGRRLLKAAQDGKLQEVRHLIKDGADVNFANKSKWTPLHVASLKGQTDIVSLLLEKGANHNARNCYGFSSLHIAARSDFSGMCSCFLIYAGCDINARNQFGRTALHYAAECGNVAAVRALMVGGAKKNSRDHEGKRPVDVAKSEHVRKFLRP